MRISELKATHPTSQELRDFASGRFPDAEARPVESHLNHCPACCEALGSLGEADPLQSRLNGGLR